MELVILDIFKVIFIKNNLIWLFQLLVPRLCSFLYFVYSRGQHSPTYVLLYVVFCWGFNSDKQRTPEDGQRIQQPKRCVSTNNNKDGDNSPKNHTQINTHQASSKKIQMNVCCIVYGVVINNEEHVCI